MTPAKTSRPSTAAPILAILAVVLVTLGAYVGGYFWLGEVSPGRIYLCRIFPYRGLATAYKPAGWVESQIRGQHIVVSIRSSGIP